MKSRVKDGLLECWLHEGHFCLESGDPVKYPARRPAEVHEVRVDETAVW